ncbi:MAG: kelch repeat-containing protein [Elusimicrobiales bacterium]
MDFRKVLFLSLLAPALLATGAGAVPLVYRHSHTTTLLPDGNILVTGGGTTAGVFIDSVQSYDMSANTFVTWTDGLTTARSSHTATLLSDGRVLIAGGFTGAATFTSTLEICDPITRTCAAIGAVLSAAKANHTATLLSEGPNAGKVLICGGQTGATAVTSACDFFDPETDTIDASAGDLAIPTVGLGGRAGHAATLLRGGRVFATGGKRWTGTAWQYVAENEMYDPQTNVWTPVSALLQGRTGHTATVLNNGKIMIAGGYNGSNRLYCQAETPGSLEDECWHMTYDPNNLQEVGTQGYVDGAEFFDQNGGRTVLAEETYGEMPYRMGWHSAVLNTSGKVSLPGGTGNIVPTFITPSPTLEDTSVINVTRTGNTLGTIDADSQIDFQLIFDLARPVSGRLMNADVFFSPTSDPDQPSFIVESAKFFLGASTSIIDGLPVGLMLGSSDLGHQPGDFVSVVSLDNPAGRVSFEPETMEEERTANAGSTLTLNPTPLYPSLESNITAGTLSIPVTLDFPNTYRSHITGIATLESGSVQDNAGQYTATLEEGATSGVFTLNVGTCEDIEKKTCSFTGTIVFAGLTGSMTNLTTVEDGTTFYTGHDMAGDVASVSMEIKFTADQVNVMDREPSYSFSQSTVVVRSMLFSSRLEYIPAKNEWGDLADDKDADTLSQPVFNHTALLTPAADTLLLGGQNCEADPAADCLRGVMNFSPATAATAIIPVYAGGTADQTAGMQTGKELTTKRAFHTSTLLPTGHILTCGGSDGARQLSSCELMDPVSKTWAATGAMNLPRANHTATLLPNGNVLVAGGITPWGVAVSSAEIFYPDTQRWVPTSSMASARQLHTATLMPDGNVLVAGGAVAGNYSDSAEIFIASTSYWVAGGNLIQRRSQHTATLLKNGNVLLAGGINAAGPMTSAEIYDYTTRTSAATGTSLSAPRYGHTAVQLRDGKVLVIGGSNGEDSIKTSDIFNGASWSELQNAVGDHIELNHNRANHRTVLMPNGKIMITGGEMRGMVQPYAESFDPDFPSWSVQAKGTGRTHHTSLMTKDNLVVNIGGWDGGKYLNTVEFIHFNHNPDSDGLVADTTRQALISTGTVYFDRGVRATLLSGTSNFHGITEASGGGSGPLNSSFSSPRLYMQQIDNPSGFMIDLSTRLYSHYGGLYSASNWETTLSSLTIVAPSEIGALPHGWYHMRVAANGVFSDGHTVQVTVPRPAGLPTEPTGAVLGTSSITWTWTSGTIPGGGAQGYAIYAASDSVFIATTAFVTGSVSYTQTGMRPNTEASIMVSAFNMGGYGGLSKSSTYYTLAAAPSSLAINSASFETAELEWSGSNNSDITAYEVSMSPEKAPKFSDPLAISTPVPFTVNHLSTATVLQTLTANQKYDFRVRAMNGAGIVTAFSNYASTITVSAVNNFSGQALSSSTINWSWDEAIGASYYEVYDITDGTASAVFVGSTTLMAYSQNGLSANRRYYAVVRAVKTTVDGPISGPWSQPVGVYTLTVPPALPANVFTGVSTGTLTVNWITNGNSTWTAYNVQLTTGAGVVVSSVTTQLAYAGFGSLAPNVAYNLTLTPYNGDQLAGATVNLGTKYTLAKVPGSLTADEITMSGISLSWDTAGNSPETTYELRSSTSDVFAEPVVTHVPFAYLSTESSAFVNGLLTATTYYFDVAARNGEGLVSARKRALAAFTVPGPAGAPSGSVGGTSSATEDVTITGTLPNNREVALFVPESSFPGSTAIAVSSSNLNPCGYLAGGLIPIEVAIYSENGAQPQVPVTLTIKFDQDPTLAKNDIINKASQVVMARYNPVSGQCLPLETTVNIGERTITATLNHFSLFQLMVRTAASNLANVSVYPNPFYANRGQGFVTIDRIPANAKVRIYTLSGDKVWEGTAGSTGVIIWKGVNKSGNLVASGIYLAVVDSSAGKKVLKLAVER